MLYKLSLSTNSLTCLLVAGSLSLFSLSTQQAIADNEPPCSECSVSVPPIGVSTDIDFHMRQTDHGILGWYVEIFWYPVNDPIGAYFKECENRNNHGLQSFSGWYSVNNAYMEFYLKSGQTRPYLSPLFEVQYKDPCTGETRRNGTTTSLVHITANTRRTGNRGSSNGGAGIQGGGLGPSGPLGGSGGLGGSASGGGDSGTQPPPPAGGSFSPQSCAEFTNKDTRIPASLDPATGVELITENILFSHRKNGIRQFNYNEEEHPTPKYFLEIHTTTSLEGGNRESPVGGSITQRTCQMNGLLVVTARNGNPSWYGTNPTAIMTLTETSASGSQEVSSYDDPPNTEEDKPAQMSFESTLSDEYTKERMMQDTFNHAWQFKGGGYYTQQYPVAGLIINKSEEAITYAKTSYKIRIPTDEETYPRPYKVTWLEEFTPEDTDPYDGVAPEKEYNFHSEEIPAGSSETMLKTIDPRDNPEKEGTWFVRLLPVDLISDFNNDGQITADDNPLRDAAMASGATDEIKDKGTEFIFHNDTLSNGIWDKEDTDPARPATEKDDDDAEGITIKVGITEGEVWLDHPAIDKLSFYKTRECNAADKVNLSPTNKFAVSASNPFPDKLFMRADVNGAPSYPEADPQFEGDLVLKIKVGTSGQEIEAVKMKLTVLKQLGAKKFFHASRDYIFENNSRLFVRDMKYSASTFRVCTICEELSTLSPIETYHDDPTPDPERKGPRGIRQTMTTHSEMTIITNGNMVYFRGQNNGFAKWDKVALLMLGAESSMTDSCQGGIVTREQFRLNPASTEAASAGGDASELATTNAKYIAQNADGSFLFEKGHLPKNPLPVAALGGLATTYDHKDRLGEDQQFVGYWPRADNGAAKGCIFTATHTSGNTNVSDLVDDARASDVPAFEGTRLKMFMLDSGDAAVTLAHLNPDGNLKLADFQQANYIRLQASYQAGVPYFTNTYLAFKTSKPRQ